MEELKLDGTYSQNLKELTKKMIELFVMNNGDFIVSTGLGSILLDILEPLELKQVDNTILIPNIANLYNHDKTTFLFCHNKYIRMYIDPEMKFNDFRIIHNNVPILNIVHNENIF